MIVTIETKVHSDQTITKKLFTFKEEHMGTELISIKEKLSDITKKAIRDKEFAVDEEEFHSTEEEPEPDIDLDEIVDEIIEFVYMAAAEGKYEFEVGSYIQSFGARNYDKISSLLKQKLYDVMVIKWTTRSNLKIYWGKSEA